MENSEANKDVNKTKKASTQKKGWNKSNFKTKLKLESSRVQPGTGRARGRREGRVDPEQGFVLHALDREWEGAALGREGDSPGTTNAYGKLSKEKTACLAQHFCLD